MKRSVLFCIGWVLFLGILGCAEPTQSGENRKGETAVPLILPTIGNIPPTFTPSADDPTPLPSVTPLPRPQQTRLVPTPIPFDDPVVTLHMRIPAIAYDRHLVGTVGSVVTLADETSRRGQERRGQAVVLIELQQALKALELETLPDGCNSCVQLDVTLPLDDFEVSGWLRDPVLLASIQNYFAVALGPHFPPETTVGLRRSASPFASAQTFALTADNRLWLWQETDAQIAEPGEASDALLSIVMETFSGRYYSEYVAPCQGVPIESLLLDPVEQDAITITIVCPAYSLSTDLLPLYAAIDERLGAAFETMVSAPPPGVPLTAVLQYQREDALVLTVYMDGATTLSDGRGNMITGTLTLAQVDGLIRPLLNNGVVQSGLTAFEQEPPADALLLVRGDRGLYDAGWPSSINRSELASLNALIDARLASSALDDEATPTPTPTGGAMPTVTPTATP